DTNSGAARFSRIPICTPVITASMRRCFVADGLALGAPLLVFADDWGRHPSSCQHLVRRLLAKHPVCWVNTIGTRVPQFDLATLRRGLGKLRQWLRPRRSGLRVPLPENLRVLNPLMWSWLRSGCDRRLNRTLLSSQLGAAMRNVTTAPVAITTLPIVADLMGVLPVQSWVYYCVDDFGRWPGLDQKT